MKTLKFTDPNENYGGSFKEVKVDLETLSADNCTVYEAISEDLPFSISVGLEILVPWSTSLAELKSLAVETGLKLECVEDSEVLVEDNIILSTFTGVQDGGVDEETTSTGIILTFEKSVLGLTSDSIDLQGADITDVTVVADTEDKEWLVGIENISVLNGENISVSVSEWTDTGITYGALNNIVVPIFIAAE